MNVNVNVKNVKLFYVNSNVKKIEKRTRKRERKKHKIILRKQKRKKIFRFTYYILVFSVDRFCLSV